MGYTFKSLCIRNFKYITNTPVYNFINGRLADKPTVLKPLS